MDFYFPITIIFDAFRERLHFQMFTPIAQDLFAGWKNKADVIFYFESKYDGFWRQCKKFDSKPKNRTRKSLQKADTSPRRPKAPIKPPYRVEYIAYQI